MKEQEKRFLEFEQANEELMAFKINGVFEMPQIEWWLMKYEYLYKRHIKTVDAFHGASIFAESYNPFNKFWQYYERLEEISSYYRRDLLLEEILKQYEQVKDNREELKEWVRQNESLYMDNLNCMWFDQKSQTVMVYLFLEEHLHISRVYFNRIIFFREIIHYLIFEEEILPETIERLENERKKLRSSDKA